MNTPQTDSMTPYAIIQPSEPLSPSDQVTVGQQVYDTQEEHVGRVAVRFPLYPLIERGWIFPRVYDVPLSLIEQVKGPSLWLKISEATLKAEDFAQVPMQINDVPTPPVSTVSAPGMYPLTPAQTGHYHDSPHSPGINTDASGSYTPAEVDPWERLRDRPTRLYITGKPLYSRDGNGERK